MISVCIITKNEINKLEKCLRALKDYPFEIVVVDTGSDDGTPEMARRYTSKVYRYNWNDDFASARNYAASKASNDFVIAVDSDETLTDIDYGKLCTAISNNPNAIGRSLIINLYERDGEQVRDEWRLGRIYNRRKAGYEGSVHEQLRNFDGTEPEYFDAPIKFEHSGYAGTQEEVSAKAKRNIALLLKECGRKPQDVYILYQLGKSYYMKQDYERAYEFFDKATYLEIDEKLEYVADLIVSYGYSMLNTGRSEKALLLENLCPEFGHRAEFRFVLALIYMNNMMFDKAYDMFMSATKAPVCHTAGVDSYKAFYNAGVIKECLGNKREALELYHMCKGYAKAKERITALTD